jgi:hypothetical protein
MLPAGTPMPGVVPVTGIADDLGLGNDLFMAGLAAVGLLAVIFVARRLRTGGRDEGGG